MPMTLARIHLMLVALMSLLLVGCSVQEAALIKVAYVQDRIEVPEGERAITVRVNRVGTTRNLEPVSAETTFLDVEGDFTLKTTKIGSGWVVVKSLEFDVAYAPVHIEEFGEIVSLGRLIPQTGVALVKKTPNEALYVAFEDDWEGVFGEVETIDVVFGNEQFALNDTARAMFDDGSQFDIDPNQPGMQTSGDFAGGDGVWTRRFVSTPDDGITPTTYRFVINKNLDRGPQLDPYQEGESSGGSSIKVP